MVAKIKIKGSKTISNVKKTLKAMDKTLKTKVVVGYPKAGKPRKGSTLSNADIAKIQSEGIGVPKRPFLQKGVESKKKEILTFLKKGVKDGMNDQMSSARALFQKAGLKAQTAIQNYMREGKVMPALSRATLRARRKQGKVGTYPLVGVTKQLSGQVKNQVIGGVKGHE